MRIRDVSDPYDLIPPRGSPYSTHRREILGERQESRFLSRVKALYRYKASLSKLAVSDTEQFPGESRPPSAALPIQDCAGGSQRLWRRWCTRALQHNSIPRYRSSCPCPDRARESIPGTRRTEDE